MYRPEWQPDRSWQNTPVTRELDERIFGWLVRLCLALILAMAPTGLYLLSMNASLDLTIRSSKLDDELQRLAEQERDLRARIAEVETPAALASWAAEEGFKPPAAERTIVWSPSSASGEWFASSDAVPPPDAARSSR